MLRIRTLTTLTMISLLPLAFGQSCGSFGGAASGGDSTNDMSTDSTTNDLTQIEQEGIDASIQSATALAQAATSSQNATDAPDVSGIGNKTLRNEHSAPGFDFGTCPNVIGIPTTDAMTLVIDFGNGCNVLGLDAYTCSGSAMGTFDAVEHQIGLTFDTLSCNDYALDGTVALTFAVSQNTAALTGDWNLLLTYDDEHVSANGAGTVSFDRNTRVATISTFTGEIIENSDDTYQATLTDIVVSYVNNSDLIPSGGTITVSSPEIRSLTIRFNSDSPSTGEVEVSINGSPFFTYHLPTD